MSASVNPAQSLPARPESERFLLGALLLEDSLMDAATVLNPDDFSIEQHRLIFDVMKTLSTRGDRLDYVAVFTELQQRGKAGYTSLSYLNELTEGIPQGAGISGHVRTIQEKALLRRGIFALQHFMNRCFQPDDSPGNLLLDCQKALDALSQGHQQHGEWITPTEVVRNYPGGPHGFVTRKKGGVGIATPWPNITELLGGGLHAGDLFLVAGRPSMGKSVVGMSLAHKAASDGHGAAVFSLEMSKESLTERLLCGLARVDNHKLRAGYLNTTEKSRLMECAADLETLPLWIDDTRARTMPAMAAALRKLCAKQSVEVVVVDHLQLMTSGARKRDQRNQELGEILHEFKHEASKLNATVVLLSQLNRQCEIENRQPQLSDLGETGSAEQDADVVLFVHRPERYAKNREREDLRGHAEFIIAKQRCGPVGSKNMIFLAGRQRFENRAGDCDEQ